jgi:predicted ATPase
MQIERGQVRQALEAAERALDLEPSHEHALGLAMRAAALRGDRAGALERFESHTARLAELGTKPTEETAALAERIRQGRSWQLDDAVPSVATEGAELRRAPLTGRDTELEKITDVWSRCINGSSAQAIVIEAASGLGKTRLAEELRARARLDGAVVASIRAVEGDLDNPWSGCLGLARSGLDAAPGVAATAPDSLAAFAQHIPDWADRFGSGSSTTSLAVAFADVVGSITEEAPLALIIDDAHWIDRDSLLALLAVLRDHASRAVTVAITVDPTHARSEVDDLRARLGRDTPGTALHLEPLPADAVRALTAWAVPSLDGDDIDRLARRIATDSAGLPLLAIELLHAVALGMDLGTIEGAWPEPFRTLDHTLPGDLPDAVVAAIRVGYRRLSVDAQSALAAIAVLEGVVSDEAIRAVTDLENAQRHAALDELEWQRWVTVDARGYSCVARIVQEVVRRDMVTKGQRERMRKAVKDAT